MAEDRGTFSPVLALPPTVPLGTGKAMRVLEQESCGPGGLVLQDWVGTYPGPLKPQHWEMGTAIFPSDME